jgi:chemotaxis signal transduction protein
MHSENAQVEYINFTIGHKLFAISIDGVEDIVKLMPINKVPLQLLAVAGIFLKDDKVAIALDLGVLYGHTHFDNNDKMVIMIQWDGDQYGLVIDSLVAIGAADIESQLINMSEILQIIKTEMQQLCLHV